MWYYEIKCFDYRGSLRGNSGSHTERFVAHPQVVSWVLGTETGDPHLESSGAVPEGHAAWVVRVRLLIWFTRPVFHVLYIRAR